MAFEKWEMDAIVIGERVSAVLSLIGELFVIFTFVFTKKFRKPVNRLIFYATWGNLIGNIAPFIARDAIKALDGRITTPLCNFQAFLEQMFFPADAFFCLCMAINVFLTVIHKYSAEQLRRLEPYYVAVSFLLPFSVAFALVFIPGPKGPFYGDAILWCWIRPEYDVHRVALFYAPVWVVLGATFFLYTWTGIVIFKMRRSLRKFANSNSRSYSRKTGTAVDETTSGVQMTTVMQVTVQTPGATKGPQDPYSCEITGGQQATTADDQRSFYIDEEQGNLKSPAFQPDTPSGNLNGNLQPPLSPCLSPRTVPSSPRLKPATNSTPDSVPKPHVKAARDALKANRAAWAYARCAMLFFIGLQITWIPSTANRLWPYVHGTANPYLSIVAAIVLPGQGFWNGVIYAATSWSSCQSLWKDIKEWAAGVIGQLMGKGGNRRGSVASRGSSTERIRVPSHAHARRVGLGLESPVGPGNLSSSRSFGSSISGEEPLKDRVLG